MKKLTITSERVFPDTTPKVITAAAGVGPRAAMRDTTHTEEARQSSPPPTQVKAAKNKGTISTKCCKFSQRNHKLSPYLVMFKYSTALNEEGHSNKFACWSNKRIHRELGLVNTRSLGITNSPGVPAPPGDSACSRVCPITDTSISRAANLGINRDTDVDKETGNNHGPARSRGFCLSDIPGAQKGWGFSSGDKSEGLKQVYSRGALQDGGVSYGQGPRKTRGLVDQARPEGCLLSGAHRPQSPKISPVSMARGNIPVLLPPI